MPKVIGQSLHVSEILPKDQNIAFARTVAGDLSPATLWIKVRRSETRAALCSVILLFMRVRCQLGFWSSLVSVMGAPLIRAQTTCDTLNPLTVKITGGSNGEGAGIIVAGDARTVWIATSGHVVAGTTRVEVSFWERQSAKVPAKVEFRRRTEMNSIDDIAFVVAPWTPATLLPPLPLRSEPVANGERVSYAGHPYELPWQCYPPKEIVSRLKYSDNPDLFLFTDPIKQAGMSGGPVSDEAGNLLGIIYGHAPGSANSIAVRTSVVLSLLSAQVNVPTTRTILLSGGSKTPESPVFDCNAASPEQMRLAIAARATERVLGMRKCRPENSYSDPVQWQFARLFDKKEFAESRTFLDRLLGCGWNFIIDTTPKAGFEPRNYNVSPVFRAVLTGNIEGLKWLADSAPSVYWSKYPRILNDFDYSRVQANFAVDVIAILRKCGVSAGYDDYAAFRNTYSKWLETQLPRSDLPGRPEPLDVSIRRSVYAKFYPEAKPEAPVRAAHWSTISKALAPSNNLMLRTVKDRANSEFVDSRIKSADADIKELSALISEARWWRKSSRQGLYQTLPKGAPLQDDDMRNGCGEAPGSSIQCPSYTAKSVRDELEFAMRLRDWLEQVKLSK